MKILSQKIKKFHQPLIPEIVQEKYKLMKYDEYKFFRGTCNLYYDALNKEKNFPVSPAVWTCGDLHLENFGSFKGDNRLVYFDLNDFDEAILAPAAWEVVRFLTSIFIAFETMRIEKKKALNMAKLFLKVYSQTLSGGKSFYLEPQTAQGIVQSFLTAASKAKQKELLDKRTCVIKGKRYMRTGKKYFEVEKELRLELIRHLEDWITYNNGRPYNFVVSDVVFRKAGLGSLGLKRYCFLLKSTNKKEKFMLVDMKQSRSSSLLLYCKIPQPKWKNEAERIITIQQRMQNIPPALLSSTNFRDEDFVIEEMQPVRDSINLNLIKHYYRDIYQVVNDMAILTASAQLRSTGRQGSANTDELVLFGQNEHWQEELLNYAELYAAKTKEHYAAFCLGYDEGLYND